MLIALLMSQCSNLTFHVLTWEKHLSQRQATQAPPPNAHPANTRPAAARKPYGRSPRRRPRALWFRLKSIVSNNLSTESKIIKFRVQSKKLWCFPFWHLICLVGPQRFRRFFLETPKFFMIPKNFEDILNNFEKRGMLTLPGGSRTFFSFFVHIFESNG